MVYDVGIRLNNELHVSFQLDAESGDMVVTVEFKNDDGELQYASGSVVWE